MGPFEDIAFYDTIISPWAETVVITDTLTTAEGVDSIVTREARDYFPNDILLTWFNEGYQSQYLSDYRRPERKKLTVDFGTRLRVIAGAHDTQRAVDRSFIPAVGSAQCSGHPRYSRYFITDSAVYGMDSMLVAMRYLRTDTASRLVWGTDTLRFSFKDPQKSKGQLKKEAKERERKIERILKKARRGRRYVKGTILPSDTMRNQIPQFSRPNRAAPRN